MIETATKKLEGNIANYARNHFRDQLEPSMHSPSLLKMKIHEADAQMSSPVLLQMKIHEQGAYSLSIRDFRSSLISD
ncbi:hypothetical protein [Cohnella hashimotonis]|uniref:Uncharacterized protein n=1 Tax=Cohnella hashimotonis TaxID=2826895 RepID=A0ABT6TBB7_9BACL|nr:hypothetical protein [Cohnella hashimotonis]MDI4644133.1 hypothetical protein [Cohnella hashimotonis]